MSTPEELRAEKRRFYDLVKDNIELSAQRDIGDIGEQDYMAARASNQQARSASQQHLDRLKFELETGQVVPDPPTGFMAFIRRNFGF